MHYWYWYYVLNSFCTGTDSQVLTQTVSSTGISTGLMPEESGSAESQWYLVVWKYKQVSVCKSEFNLHAPDNPEYLQKIKRENNVLRF
jgi:hypothetical protein